MPTRSGNQRLTITGSSTLVRAMPARDRALAARNPAALLAKGRISRPVAMAAMPAQTTAAGPKRRESRGAVTPTAAKQRAGTEVISPATVPLMPRPVRVSSKRAPRLVMAGRRLRAARTMPTMRTGPSHCGCGAAAGVAAGRGSAW
ncbi:hypothetical protein GCM10020254_63600 [Streptomyces goshikiensis]